MSIPALSRPVETEADLSVLRDVMTMPSAARHLEISMSLLKQLVRETQIRTFTIGRRRLLSRGAILKFLADRADA